MAKILNSTWDEVGTGRGLSYWGSAWGWYSPSSIIPMSIPKEESLNIGNCRLFDKVCSFPIGACELFGEQGGRYLYLGDNASACCSFSDHLGQNTCFIMKLWRS